MRTFLILGGVCPLGGGSTKQAGHHHHHSELSSLMCALSLQIWCFCVKIQCHSLVGSHDLSWDWDKDPSWDASTLLSYITKKQSLGGSSSVTGRPRRGLWVLLLFSGSFVQAPAAMAGMKIKKRLLSHLRTVLLNCIDCEASMFWISWKVCFSEPWLFEVFLFWGSACKMQHMLQLYVLKLVS